jgi:phosphohistidine phosphatase
MIRTLYLLRHAKSSWDDPTLPDHNRPLAARGRRACVLIADHLRHERIRPGLVVCSSATRSRETLERIAPGFVGPVETLVEDDLYRATAADLLSRLRDLDRAVAVVMVIGHQPAIQELALNLVRTPRDRQTLSNRFPTAALATLTFTSTWNALPPGSCTLEAFVRPRDLSDQASR